MQHFEASTGTSLKRKSGPDFSNVGPENDNHASAWRDCMDYARLEIDYATLKHSFLAWARQNRDVDELVHWSALDNWQYATVGRMTWCIQHGAAMPEDVAVWFDAKIAELLTVKGVVVDEEPERKLGVAQRRNLEYTNLYSRIDALCRNHKDSIDQIEDSVRKLLSVSEPNQQMLKRLYEHYKESFNDAIREKDNPLVMETIDPLIAVVNLLATSTGNAKAIRDSRGATSKSIKQAAKVKFKTVDLDTDMASISPAMIPGSKMIIVYNSKNRKLAVYVAESESLGIKNTKITGFDQALSYAKTLRKPKQVLPGLRDATSIKRVDLVIGEYVKGKKHTVNGKLNKDTLLIKVFK